MPIADARNVQTSFDDAGFELVPHLSALADFTDRAAVGTVHRQEIVELLGALSGADLVVVSSPGVLRFSEKSPRSGALDNSRPARFAHVDISDTTAAEFARRATPEGRSLTAHDLILADAVFDPPGRPDWSFEGLVLAHHPAHRWHWFPDMTRG